MNKTLYLGALLLCLGAGTAGADIPAQPDPAAGGSPAQASPAAPAPAAASESKPAAAPAADGAQLQTNPLPSPAAAPPGQRFGFADVARLAKTLASRGYAEDQAPLPDYLAKLSYDQYRDIRFKRDQALWYGSGLPFQIELFHRGFLFNKRVAINVIDGAGVTPVHYSPAMFDFGRNTFTQMPAAGLGFAGFRVLYPVRHGKTLDEVAVFLGASYFRAVGAGQAYGISARGLALDTGLTRAEEFPYYKEFWIEKPQADSDTLTVYALMDSESVTGAYRFVIHPGLEVVMNVKSRIFVRSPVQRFGIAPLTSMFFHGENTDRFIDDYRPEVHDSDGLLVAMHNGEWVWRPLNNPRKLAISVFRNDSPVGFGLMQRDRDFDHYQDLEARYEKRPSAWVETLGDWGRGAVQLIEIPSDAEKYDNIVAFWVPDQPTAGDQVWSFDYRVHFMLDNEVEPPGGRVVATRVGGGGTDVLSSARRKFVVDFAGAELRALAADAPVQADLSASAGTVLSPVVQKNPENGGWRLVFEFKPEPGAQAIDLRADLRLGGRILTETWIGQWTP